MCLAAIIVPVFLSLVLDDGVSSHGEASSNIATSSSRDGNRHGRAASDSKSRVATGGTSLEKADSLQTDHAGAMQINISPDIISHVRWPKVSCIGCGASNLSLCLILVFSNFFFAGSSVAMLSIDISIVEGTTCQLIR